jgi:hypothetical protein
MLLPDLSIGSTPRANRLSSISRCADDGNDIKRVPNIATGGLPHA